MGSHSNDTTQIIKLLLWFATCVAAWICIVAGHPFSLWAVLYLPLFPLGLAPNATWRPDGYHVFCWASGWVLYGFLTLVALATRRKLAYAALYVALVILLVLNVSGCKTLLMKAAHEPFAT